MSYASEPSSVKKTKNRRRNLNVEQAILEAEVGDSDRAIGRAIGASNRTVRDCRAQEKKIGLFFTTELSSGFISSNVIGIFTTLLQAVSASMHRTKCLDGSATNKHVRRLDTVAGGPDSMTNSPLWHAAFCKRDDAGVHVIFHALAQLYRSLFGVGRGADS